MGHLAVALIRSALLTPSYPTLLYRVDTATQPNDAAFRPVLGGRTTWHLSCRAVDDMSAQFNGSMLPSCTSTYGDKRPLDTG